MKKILFFTLIVPFIGALVGLSTWMGGQGFSPDHNTGNAGTEKAVASLQTKQSGVPIKLLIPQLAIEARIESVGMDSSSRMDVPKNADNVAWYNLGYKPGEKGNAVIAGHFDKATGDPAVFYNLEKLNKGDHVITIDEKGGSLTFAVIRIVTYPDNEFPLQEVFGTAEKPMLNLITCDGKWDNKTKSYSHRIVVYAEMIE
jgi:LPXTG-site transpeptidase (sortase) family protein